MKSIKEIWKEFDVEEREYIYWLIYRKDKQRHISEDIVSKLGMNDLEDYQHEGILAKWDKLTS